MYFADPVRKEEGSQVWDFAYDGSKEMAVVTETWSNIRTMLKHVYISPTVRRVFYSREFAHTIQKQNLKGPLAVSPGCVTEWDLQWLFLCALAIAIVVCKVERFLFKLHICLQRAVFAMPEKPCCDLCCICRQCFLAVKSLLSLRNLILHLRQRWMFKWIVHGTT